MKKTFIALALVGATTFASSAELGVTLGTTHQLQNTFAGVSFTQRFEKYSTELTFDRTLTHTSFDRYSYVNGYDVMSLGKMTFTPKVGVSYISRDITGYALSAGVGASYPINKKVSFVVDYKYQVGQKRVEDLDGSSFSTAIKYSF